MTWQQYEQTEHWKALRNAVLTAENNSCEHCGKPTIVVHHCRYRNFFDCTADDLMVLCNRCHMRIHAYIEHRKMAINLSRRVTTDLLKNGRVAPYPVRPISHSNHVALSSLCRFQLAD